MHHPMFLKFITIYFDIKTLPRNFNTVKIMLGIINMYNCCVKPAVRRERLTNPWILKTMNPDTFTNSKTFLINVDKEYDAP